MTDILTAANQMQQAAKSILAELKIIEIWAKHGAKANLVGSLATGLLMKRRDIDLHIYSDNFSIAESFAAISEIAEQQGITEVIYKNLLDTEEKCLEWHAYFKDKHGNIWNIDMIHILKDTKYAGYFEDVAAQISAALTEETRLAILTIKNDAPQDAGIMGIEIYKAVLQNGVRTYAEFENWRKANPPQGIIMW